MAERTLRERCIEAGGAAMTRYYGQETNDNWRPEVVAVFDAVLGVLTEHADEWVGDVDAMEWEGWSERAIVSGLLAVLEAVSDD